jgi:hypothetical protein
MSEIQKTYNQNPFKSVIARETFHIIQFAIIQIPLAIVLIYSSIDHGSGGTLYRWLE